VKELNPSFPSRPRARHAAAAVEFALAAPIFFLFVFGLVEVGRACMVNEMLTEAARQGCRVGIIEGTSSATIQQAATSYLSGVGINGETANVVINDQAANSVEAATMPAYTEITVQVSVPVSSVTWVPTWFVPGTISAQYTMRRE
jgi:Flp pilus assembly protein TadG